MSTQSTSTSAQNNTPEGFNDAGVPYVGKKFLWIICIICAAVVIFGFIAFFWRRDIFKFGSGYVLDNELWGTLGDFIGGVLGSFLAALSFLMMYWTLKAQRELALKTDNLQSKLSQNAINQAELQRFNDLYFELLSLYHKQVKELNNINNNNFFNSKMKEMQDRFKDYASFGIGWRFAKEKYLNFYLENSGKLAPVFRTLYRLYCLVDTANINNEDKLEYAKTVRAQLSEGELFFLRYNCLTIYGQNFTNLINKYRITKHLPFLSLLENTALRKKVSTMTGASGLAINSLTYSIWKEIYNRIVNKKEQEQSFVVLYENKKYRLSILVNAQTKIILQLIISKTYHNNTPALRCLDNLQVDLIQKLLFDLLREMILFSNSKTYTENHKISFDSKRKDTTDTITIFSIAKIREGRIRVSHPDWDKYYGIA